MEPDAISVSDRLNAARRGVRFGAWVSARSSDSCAVLEGVDGREILEELRRVDELTLRFSSFGLGGRMEPEASARFLFESLRRVVLADEVPEDVRLNFERVKRLHLYGLLEYDFFSAAVDLAHLVLEGAVRHRFVSYYEGRIPVFRGDDEDTLAVSVFDDVYEALREVRKQKSKLRLREGEGEPLPRGFSDLVGWARRRGLLPGQRNMIVLHSLVRLRNYAAHPERNSVDMPPESVRLLNDVAEIINKLWARDTVGGRLYPPPVARRPRVVALSDDGQASVQFGSVAAVRAVQEERRGWTYAVYLAAADEELVDFAWGAAGGQRFSHTPGQQTTRYPCERLWGPGAWDELVAVLDRFDGRGVGDAVPYLDRLFMIRVCDGEAEMPRAAADVAAQEAEDDRHWYAVVADHPLDALQHVRTHAADFRRLEQKTCIECHAMFVGHFDSDGEARRFAEGRR